jgi:hypothetical protein
VDEVSGTTISILQLLGKEMAVEVFFIFLLV